MLVVFVPSVYMAVAIEKLPVLAMSSYVQLKMLSQMLKLKKVMLLKQSSLELNIQFKEMMVQQFDLMITRLLSLMKIRHQLALVSLDLSLVN